MTDSGASQVFLPLNLFYPVRPGPGFSSEARLIFRGKQSAGAESKGFRFSEGTLESVSIQSANEYVERETVAPGEVPYLSLLAIFLLIIFRNWFYGSFTKYFLSLRNNYEIDFNFQRIGFIPIIFCISVVFLSTCDLFRTGDFGLRSHWRFLGEIRLAFMVLGLPILVSSSLFFFLDFSGKIFPLVFSDLKALFYLSVALLIWNFSTFGTQIQTIISKEIFVICLAFMYLIFRSFFFFNVFVKAFRFRIATTLFYICVLNLTAFFLFTKGLPGDFFRFL